jgi:teichuronic acid biosynthesis glycosyltransferase TuaG
MQDEIVGEAPPQIPIPVVSVITPVYNARRYLDRLIKSVEAQFYPLEHVVVDDCSTDGSYEVLVELARSRPWMKVHRLSENSGPVFARNFAIKMSVGRYLAFLDADDFWLPGKLVAQVDFMATHKCPMTFTDYRHMSECGRMVGDLISGPSSIDWHKHHTSRFIGCLTVMIDRAVVSDFEFPRINPSVRAEDFLAWSSVINKHGPATRVPLDLARYAVVPNSRSSRKIQATQSVWLLYRQVEGIPLFEGFLLFARYLVFAVFKHFSARPTIPAVSVDGKCAEIYYIS